MHVNKYHMLLSQLLFEMNVANLDRLKSALSAMLNTQIDQRGVTVAPAILALIQKRALKAIQNDEEGKMTLRQPVTEVPDNAPAWLRTALDRGDEVFNLTLRPEFQTSMAHIIDWIAVDPNAARIVKAAPEQDYLNNLYHAAEDYFAAKQKSETSQTTMAEEGREVAMTFRMKDHQIQHFMERDLANDPERGPVVMFWAKLTSDQALNREGQMMGHCVGSYCNLVQDAKVIIYSLRDAKNDPHATVELNHRVNPPQINQVKGKGNQPPTGKYAPFIRDFLNELGITASWSAVTDLKGMGLLTYGGKYGTITEVGGKILTTFDNGDSLRLVEEEKEEVPSWQRQNQGEQSLDYWYVEKNGTTPFTFSVFHRGEDIVQDLKILRQEPGRYPTYAKNLAKVFNEKKIEGGTDTVMAAIGLIYDPFDNNWGTPNDLMLKLFDFKGVTVSRLATSVFFMQKNVIFAKATLVSALTRGRRRNPGSLMQMEITKPDASGTRLMPDLIAAYYKHIDLMPENAADNEKNLLWNFGLFATAKGFKTVPDDKIIFTSKHGSVRHFRHRFYFYDPTNTFAGTIYVGAGSRAYVNGIGSRDTYTISTNDIKQAPGKKNYKIMLTILADLTQSDDGRLHVRVDNFSYDKNVSEAGFFQRSNMLVQESTVQFKINVRGLTVQMKPTNSGNREIIISQGENPLIEIEINNEDVVKNITKAGEYNERGNMAFVQQYRSVIATALNVAKVKMLKRTLIGYSLAAKGNKIYPQTDKDMLSLARSAKIDLGKNFVANASDSGQMKHTRSDRSESDKRYGSIEWMGGDQSYGDTVVSMYWVYSGSSDVSYQMRKDLPDGVSRKDVIQAASRFMHIFHEKIEPYISNQYVGLGAGENEMKSED
jgi:hypothetical protein